MVREGRVEEEVGGMGGLEEEEGRWWRGEGRGLQGLSGVYVRAPRPTLPSLGAHCSPGDATWLMTTQRLSAATTKPTTCCGQNMGLLFLLLLVVVVVGWAAASYARHGSSLGRQRKRNRAAMIAMIRPTIATCILGALLRNAP